MDQEEKRVWATAARSPRTMGKTAKGPSGMASFLKEKSQNELVRGRLAPEPTIYLSFQSAIIKQELYRGPGHRDHLVALVINGSALLSLGYPAGLWEGAGEGSEVVEQTLVLPKGQRLGLGSKQQAQRYKGGDKEVRVTEGR